MAETAVPLNPVILATLVTLRAAIPTVSFGRQQAPKFDPGGLPRFPYGVVYLIPNAGYDGPINDGQVDVVHNIQVTVVGETAESVDLLSDDVEAALRSETTPPNPVSEIVIAGREVSLVDVALRGSVDRDDTFQPPKFYAVNIFDIHTTPA